MAWPPDLAEVDWRRDRASLDLAGLINRTNYLPEQEIPIQTPVVVTQAIFAKYNC
jgi:hypothetical protein